MVNAGDPVPFIPPIPSIGSLTDAYFHVGFGITLNNSSAPKASEQLDFYSLFDLYSLIERVLSQDWFH